MKRQGLGLITALLACGLTVMGISTGAMATTVTGEQGQQKSASAKVKSSPTIAEQIYQLSGNKLKELYLECDVASTKSLLGLDEAMYCSQVYEALLKKEFNNSFTDFMEWWRSNKAS